MSGYFDSPWPGEDGTPSRLQASRGPALPPAGPWQATLRPTLMSTMTVLGAPGEVFLLTHSALRASFGLPTSARIERIDAETLAPVARSPRLPGGPMWPGGMAIHANGDLYVVYGRYAHRLDRECRIKAELKLPVNAPYNSFVILDNGLIATKNLSATDPARLSFIDPSSLAIIAEVECPEASVARLSAVGNSVYVVGVQSIFRYHWDDRRTTATIDRGWRHAYLDGAERSHGWDVVLALGHAWFMDNGRHRYRTSMIGAGVAPAPNRLIRVSLDDATNAAALEISGLPRGSITNPPLVDPDRRIVVAFDSANRYMRAWRFNPDTLALDPLWEKHGLGCASHMILYADAGLIVTNDYRRRGEEVVMLDIATGAEQSRVRIGGLMQGVVFPSTGWNRDLYWCSMRRVARIFA